MPCCCYHCCSAVVSLARCILQPTLALNKAKHGGQSNRLLLPSHSLHHSGSPFKVDQPGPGGHPGPPRVSLTPVLALRMHREAGGPGREATITPDHHTGNPTLSTAHLSLAGHSAVALGKNPWTTPRFWQQPGEVHGESLCNPETQLTASLQSCPNSLLWRELHKSTEQS